MGGKRPPGEELKPYHDVIILGTGLVEAILAAALAKVGKTVLQFEKNEYYGNDEHSSFDLGSLAEWIESHRGPLPDSSSQVGAAEVVPTPEPLRRQWPRVKWGGALLGGARRDDDDEGKEEDPSSSTTAAEGSSSRCHEGAVEGQQEEEEEVPPVDPGVPLRCVSVPVLPKAYSSVRVLATHGIALQQQQEEEEDGRQEGEQLPLSQEEEEAHSQGGGLADEGETGGATTTTTTTSRTATATTTTTVIDDSRGSSGTAESEGESVAPPPPPPPPASPPKAGGGDTPSSSLHTLAASASASAAGPPSPPPSNDEASEKRKKLLADVLAAAGGVRAFMLDVTPTVLLSAGEVVEGLCSSGVANYMEFKPFQGLYIAGTSSRDDGGAGQGGAGPIPVHKVPCSKADVFTSKLLSAKDKRQLMKMLQFVTDWAFKRQQQQPAEGGEEEVVHLSSRNEVELAQGRSLHRPQNKGMVNLDADAFSDRPLSDFLQHGAKLDRHAQWVVTYALALANAREGAGLTTEQGLTQLARHLNGLGRYGTETAFLWPVYGANEFIHSFCRTSAVWGAIQVLRESISHILLTEGDDRAAAGKGLGRRCLGVVDEVGEALSCEAIILGQDYLPHCRSTGRRIIKRISVLDGPLVGGEGGDSCSSSKCQRAGGVLPPHTIVGQPYPIYFYQVDSETMVVPAGLVLVYLVTMVEDDDAQGRDGGEGGEGAATSNITDHALQALLEAARGKGGDPTTAAPEELWGVTIEAHILEPQPQSFGGQEQVLPAVCNVHFISRDHPPEFYLQSPMEQARTIFHRLCPDEPFLPAEVPPEVAQYLPNLGFNDVEDEDKEILESMSRQLQLQQQQAPPREKEKEEAASAAAEGPHNNIDEDGGTRAKEEKQAGGYGKGEPAATQPE